MQFWTAWSKRWQSVEVAQSGVNWLEPRQTCNSLRFHLLPSRGRSHGIASHHRRKRDGQHGTWGAFADGSVHFLGNEIPAEKLRPLLTIDAGDNALFDRE